jgi:hypothetical protein
MPVLLSSKPELKAALKVGRVMADEVFVDSEVLLVFSDLDMHDSTSKRPGTDGQ